MARSRTSRRGSSGSEDRVPAPPAQEADPFEVMELVDFLRRNLLLVGLMGMEFVFFHRFFNEGLQEQLRELRQQLYGSDDPPMPMTFEEAERKFGSPMGPMMDELQEIANQTSMAKAAVEYAKDWLMRCGVPESVDASELAKRLAETLIARGDKDDGVRHTLENLSFRHMFFKYMHGSFRRLSDEIKQSGLKDVSGHFSVGSLRNLDMLAKPIPQGHRSERLLALLTAATQLHELADALPASEDSLSMAVVCGTPPVPHQGGISVIVQPTGPVELHIKVYSAKLRRLALGYQITTEKFWLFKYGSPSESPPIDVAWSDTFPPYLEMRITPRDGVVPCPSQVGQVFKRARRGKRFYDSRTKVHDYDVELEAWAKATLSLACGMGNREIQIFWAEQVEDEPWENLASDYDWLWSRTTTSREVVLSQQITRISNRIQEIRSLTRI